MAPAPDPGWRPDWKLFLAPSHAGSAVNRQPSALAGLRTVWVTFAVAIVLFGVVLAVIRIEEPEDGLGSSVAAAIIVGLGVVALVGGRFLGRLVCSSPEGLVQGYRTRFFLRVALAESVALIGFVFAFIAGGIEWYLLALPFTAVGFWRAAPTNAHIEQDQQRLQAEGCVHDLRAALLAPPSRQRP